MIIIPIIIEQHAEEAAFLWLIRETALHEPHYDISSLAKLDEKIEAQIDGLRVAGNEGWEIFREILSLGQTGEIFTIAVFAFESRHKDKIQIVTEAGTRNPDLSRGIVSALGWLSYTKAKFFIQQYSNADSTELRRIGTASYAIHRQESGIFFQDGIFSSDTLLKARTLKAIGELGKIEFTATLQDQFEDEDDKCRFYAAWSSGLLGSMAGVPVLQAIAQTQGPFSEQACIAALRRMPIAEGLEWQRALAKKADLQRMAIIGAGSIGDPVLIPWLIEYMAIPELARVAGESFSMITGVDLAYEDLEREWPEGFEAGPTENPEDEDVDMDPDEDLPWPEPLLIQEWWQKNKANFKNGVRHLCGRPITEEQCQHVLRNGFQRQRAAAAMELAMMNPGQPLFNVKAPGFRQQKLLGLK